MNKKYKLTNQMRDFFINLALCVSLFPDKIIELEDKWLSQCMIDFREMNFQDQSEFELELRGLFFFLDQYSRPEALGNEKVAHALHVLFTQLRKLSASKRIYRNIPLRQRPSRMFYQSRFRNSVN